MKAKKKIKIDVFQIPKMKELWDNKADEIWEDC